MLLTNGYLAKIGAPELLMILNVISKEGFDLIIFKAAACERSPSPGPATEKISNFKLDINQLKCFII